jgi:GMP synthase (glutamine-hydrolysing)
MLNHRLLNAPRDTSDFVKSAINFLQKYAKDKKVFCALSGGVDSTATYLLLKKAKINAISAFIDHGLMRLIRGTEEREYVKKSFPDVVIIDIREQFLPKVFGEGDAEVKRKLFKGAYSDTINRFVKEEKCDLLADGTILPDIEESFGVSINDLKETMSIEEELALKEKKKDGFVKSQHNVDIQYNIKATIQPVASLTKDRVRDVLKFFNMPQELIYRKAFPGPALAARIIGPVTPENLDFEKKVHDIVESEIDDYYFKKFGKQMIVNDLGEQEPFQAFAAIGEDIINKKVTGIVNGKRTYEYPISIKGKWDYEKLFRMASTLEGYSRIFYEMERNLEGKYDVVIRSINSKDARTANPTNLPLDLLTQISKKILQFTETKGVFYDLTPKPPGTIEYV